MTEAELIAGVKQWSLTDLLEPEGSNPSKKDKTMQAGFPGHMTQAEVDIYVTFKKEVEDRGGEFKNTRNLDIIKKQAFIDSLCYPETMNKTVIINAPRFFTATWSIIKGFLDQRTVGKVDLFSNKAAGEKKLKEIIDVDQIPSDYGGTGESTDVLLAKEAAKDSASGGRSRLITEVMYIRSNISFKFSLRPEEEAELFVYTRALTGASFKVTDAAKKSGELLPKKTVKHSGGKDEHSPPTCMPLTSGRISGGIEIKVKGESLKSRMSSESYLLVANIYKK